MPMPLNRTVTSEQYHIISLNTIFNIKFQALAGFELGSLIFCLFLICSGGWHGFQSHVDEKEETRQKSCGGKFYPKHQTCMIDSSQHLFWLNLTNWQIICPFSWQSIIVFVAKYIIFGNNLNFRKSNVRNFDIKSTLFSILKVNQFDHFKVLNLLL